MSERFRVIFSRPLTAPRAALPQSFEQVADEANLSADFQRRFPWLGERSEILARLWLAWKLLRLRRRCDVVVTGRYGEFFALLQGLIPFGKRPHLLLDVEWYADHGATWRDRLSRWLHRRVTLGATKVQVFCQAEASNYAGHFRTDESRFVWMPYCATGGAGPELVEPADFIFTSGFHERDYVTLLHAVDGLPIELRIVADRSTLAHLPLPSNVRILGLLPADEYAEALAASRFVVLSLDPAVRRRPGVITCVGAMNAGKCVVTNDATGSFGYVEDGETGFIVPGADADALRTRIRFLLDDPDRVRKVGQNARGAAAERFSSSRYYENIERVAREIARRRSE